MTDLETAALAALATIPLAYTVDTLISHLRYRRRVRRTP
jgi:hypothetical protein